MQTLKTLNGANAVKNSLVLFTIGDDMSRKELGVSRICDSWEVSTHRELARWHDIFEKSWKGLGVREYADRIGLVKNILA